MFALKHRKNRASKSYLNLFSLKLLGNFALGEFIAVFNYATHYFQADHDNLKEI